MQRLSLEAGEHSRRSNSLKFVPSTPLNSSRRSSLLHGEGGGVAGILHESVTLSPIPVSHVAFKSLRDAVGRSVTIKSSDQSLVRTCLPPLATSNLVKRSFVALRAALPQDVYLSVAARFFCVRNAPGPADFSPQAEWAAFRSTLLALLGFDAKTLDSSSSGGVQTSPVMEVAKKSRTNIEEGSESDWEYLINSQYTRTMGQEMSAMFGFDIPARAESQIEVDVSSDSALFAFLPHVLLVLHLLYEDLKLDMLLWAENQLLATLLIPLASSLNLTKYCDAYWRDFPLIWNRVKLGVVSGPSADFDKLQPMVNRMETPCNIYNHLLWVMQRKNGPNLTAYPHVKQVNGRSRDLITLYAILYGQPDASGQIPFQDFVRDFDWIEHVSAAKCQSQAATTVNDCNGPPLERRHASAVLKMTELKWTAADVSSLPAGIGLPLRHAFYKCQLEPATDWPDETYQLINRHDMSKSAPATVDPSAIPGASRPMMSLKSEIRQRKSATGSKDDTDDGMEDVIDLPIWKLRFPKDHRVQEVRRLLCSSRPVTVTLPTAQQQGLSEHELIEEREKQLLVLCIRIMALPIGRGMFTTWTTTPTVTETLTVPKFVAILIQFLILFLDNYFRLFALFQAVLDWQNTADWGHCRYDAH